MDGAADTTPTPPPLPTSGGRKRRRSFWRSPLGVLTAIMLGLLALVLATVAALGIAIKTGYLPDTAALAGDRLSGRVVDILKDADIIEDDEQVQYYYSGGLFDFLEDGNLFTDRRVISYWQDGGDLQIDSAPYTEIEDITVAWTDNWVEDTEITVKLTDGDELTLFVSNENRGDHKFHAELRRLWEQHR